MNSIELFAGAGGLAIGLNKAGFVPKAIVEFNKNACQTLRTNSLFDYGSNLFEGDIANFDYLNILEEVDLISGGPPCQPFSLGGKAKGHNDSRDMFPEAVRAIREQKPKAFVFENVKGLLRKNFNEYFEYIILQLQYPSIYKIYNEKWEQHKSRLAEYHLENNHSELEYKVVYQLINAADYGIPQKRERIFIIGFRSDMKVKWSFPKPTHSEDALIWHKWVSKEYWRTHNMACSQPNDKILK